MQDECFSLTDCQQTHHVAGVHNGPTLAMPDHSSLIDTQSRQGYTKANTRTYCHSTVIKSGEELSTGSGKVQTGVH